MYDNKIRLSPDVLEKANQIAREWGLKNARAAVEAVFRKYSDDYLHGHSTGSSFDVGTIAPMPRDRSANSSRKCEALDELDDLLGL